ncbi:MAG: thermonuclease family protein [Planctomycetes bacterium]|nr:thermonuclease family protein [Planctomycetota bacterium]
MRLLPLLLIGALSAAEHGEILAVLGADRLAVQYYQLPVVVRLAEIEIPDTVADAARGQLEKSAGRKSNITWAPDLGADDAGTPRVYIALGSDLKTLNEALVESGLARVKALGSGGRQRERLAAAEAKAKAAKSGLWAGEAPAAAVKTASAPFCAEVDGKHYYPSDAPEAARLNPKRLVSYASEAAARKAGKIPWQASAPSAAASTIEDARAAYGRGKKLVEDAAGKGPTPERDELYERAFLELSGALQVFNRLAEAKPDDEKLGEELRQCAQLRYAAMKSKRYSK